MKGYALTPEHVVDLMIDRLFAGSAPSVDSRVLDPGCGTGVFLEGVLRWCSRRGLPPPALIGVDTNPAHVATCRKRFEGLSRVQIRETDFLKLSEEPFEYIIGNPPYVSILELSVDEREEYRRSYATARHRFDLYLLFFEKALQLLKTDGRLVYITPEKYLYVETAAPLRQLLSRYDVEELRFLDEHTFGDLVTYPLITSIAAREIKGHTRIILRNGIEREAHLGSNRSSWLPRILGEAATGSARRLADTCVRISCGVATGADAAYVVKSSELKANLRAFARPTIAGREIRRDQTPVSTRVMLLPYDASGRLLKEEELGALGSYLSEPERRARLLRRTCVQRKPWYAFHETPPLPEVLRPKLLCKDIAAEPFFVPDYEGELVPRHSVYYVVPTDPGLLGALHEYLNSREAIDWLSRNCQRAANGFLRVQSHVLKELPIPVEFASPFQPELFEPALAEIGTG